jgi:hypothetical protein
LPTTARPNQKHHGSACRTAAYARRRRAEARRTSPTTRLAALSPEQQAALDQATSEVRLVALVARAANGGSWRAATWLLERRWPERWSVRDRPQSPPPVLSTEEADALREIDELARRRRRPPGY